MNHLAHLYLSQTNVDLMVGNFIADRVKGKDFLNYSEGVQKGIEMHRAIDTFTDEHAVVMKSKKRLFPVYHKYAAVIVDMFYDHILAKNWQEYSPIPLKLFAQNTYKVLQARVGEMPKASQRILFYMSTGDWLTAYATEEGMNRALGGLASRAKFDSKMEYASIDLMRDYALYEEEFTAFFKELVAFSARYSRSDD